MKSASSWIFKALCILGLLGLAYPVHAETGTINRPVYLPLVSSSTSPIPAGQAPSRSPAWLEYLNNYRSQSGLPVLKEDVNWSSGDRDHAVYMVKNGIISHTEVSTKPFYTQQGSDAASSSNVMVSSDSSTSDVGAIDMWLAGPFHALGILDPRLSTTGFGSYRDISATKYRMAAALDVLRGLGALPAGVHFPVMWPGNGSTIGLYKYAGNESPNPLTPCSGYSAPTGLPVLLQLDPGQPAALQAHAFSQGSTALESCAYNKDASPLDSVGKSILESHNAIVLIPRAPLVSGKIYTVSITNNGVKYTWSFSAGS